MITFRRGLFFLAASLCLTLTLSACGKKGPPVWIEKKTPGVPISMKAHYRPDRITLTWSVSKDGSTVIGYNILRSENGGRFISVATVKAPAYSDTDIDPLGSYRYRVIATSKDKLESPAASTGSISSMEMLGKPASASLTVSKDGVVLSWEIEQDVSGYNVYRSASSGKYPPAPINSSLIKVGEFKDMPETERAYYYTVRAAMTSTDGELFVEGPGSRELTISPKDFIPLAPTGLDAAATGDKVVVFWNESPESWVRGYKVYRAAGGNEEFLEVGRSQTLAFADRNPLSGTLLYKVSALGPISEGPMSEPVKIKY